jgi:hypothetical protein
MLLSGDGPFPTAAIVLKDSIFLPIPSAIQASFIPQGEDPKRFEIRADILRTEQLNEAGSRGGVRTPNIETGETSGA